MASPGWRVITSQKLANREKLKPGESFEAENKFRLGVRRLFIYVIVTSLENEGSILNRAEINHLFECED
jgi:hypothetical protein